MPHNPLNPQLELLIPWELPTQTLEGDRLTQTALQQFLQVLSIDDIDQALHQVSQAIADLSSISTTPAQVSETKLPLKYWEIEDFDAYFNVCHIQTDRPDIALVKGLLLSYYRFLQTIRPPNSFDSTQITLQRSGFIVYAQLLLRMQALASGNTV